MKREEELTKIVEDYFKLDGWEAYKEVSDRGGKRCDLFLKKDNISIVVETKLNIGLKVIEQAFKWRLQSSYCYICVPYKHKTDYTFAFQICRDYGIGIIFYYENNNYLEIKLEPFLTSEPTFLILYEEQKESIGGNSNSSYITPFKLTVRDLTEYVKHNINCDINVALVNIKHHYSSTASAKTAILKMIRIGVIKNINACLEGRKYILNYKI